MIEITIREAINVGDCLKKISEQTINAITAFRIARIIKELDTVNENIIAARKNILNKYSKETDENFSEENALLNKEMENFLNEKVNLNANPLNIEDLENISITTKDAYFLLPFIKEKNPSL